MKSLKQCPSCARDFVQGSVCAMCGDISWMYKIPDATKERIKRAKLALYRLLIEKRGDMTANEAEIALTLVRDRDI